MSLIWIGAGLIWLGAFLAALLLVAREGKPDPVPGDGSQPGSPPTEPPALSAEAQAQLRRSARLEFEEALKHSVDAFSADLERTSGAVIQQIRSLSLTTTAEGLDAYKEQLKGLEAHISGSIEETHRSIAAERDRLLASLRTETDATKAELRAALDQRLSDVVASYLVETLGAAGGIGIEKDWLLGQLEVHKDDLKREIFGETPPPA